MASARAPASEHFEALRFHLLCHGPFGAFRGTHNAVDLRGARELAASDLFLAVLDRAIVQRVPAVGRSRLDLREVERLRLLPVSVFSKFLVRARRSITRSGIIS